MAQAVVFLLFCFFACSACEGIVVSRAPQGSYCGNYFELAKVRMTILETSGLLDIWLSILGTVTDCKRERWIFDAETNDIILPDATKPNNCIGKLLTLYHSTLKTTYIPTTNVILLNASGTDIKLKSCG